MNYDNIAVLIPAYKPDRRLNQLVDDLHAAGFHRIVVVDDGGQEPFREIFNDLEGKAEVLIHEVNRGKGAALKTGLAHIMKTPGISVVTADADGQHTPSDVALIANELIAKPDTLVLGVRDKSQMPPRSKAGNTLTCGVFALTCGKWISDTQTGLRGLPACELAPYSTLEGDRYEYEMNMLIYAARQKTPVAEVKIETIYIDNNSGSHFNAVRDGLRIYKLLFGQVGKFMGSSLLSALVDYLIFLLLCLFMPNTTLVPIIIARAISSAFNYFVNREVVFRAKNCHGSFLRYYLLVAAIALLSWLGIKLLGAIGIGRLIAKPIVDGFLFIVSYRVQNKLVFKRDDK
jgi:glycosyltransferase involved in cell wall biosynthesis